VAAITLAQATTIVEATLTKGRELGLDPLTVVVLDSGGHAVALKREDGSGILRPQIAMGKAWGALGMGVASRELARRAEEYPVFVAALPGVSGGRVVPAPGGVLVHTSGRHPHRCRRGQWGHLRQGRGMRRPRRPRGRAGRRHRRGRAERRQGSAPRDRQPVFDRRRRRALEAVPQGRVGGFRYVPAVRTSWCRR
jgi:uncharacterized protein GlcG (DUF336 family)